MSGKQPKTTSSFYSSSIEETFALAADLVRSLGGRGVISLEGPLGAGKTHFVKGAAAALNLEDQVTSPTFTLLQIYGNTEQRLYHFDFYRLQEEAEAVDLGLEDYFAEHLTIIEWGNKFPLLLPPETLHVTIKPFDNGTREIAYYTLSPS